MTPEAGAAAAQLWRQYGEDAVVIAVLRAAEVAAMGDVEALRHWDEVREILTAMSAPDGPAN
jgi:hypothetical protein